MQLFCMEYYDRNIGVDAQFKPLGRQNDGGTRRIGYTTFMNNKWTWF